MKIAFTPLFPRARQIKHSLFYGLAIVALLVAIQNLSHFLTDRPHRTLALPHPSCQAMVSDDQWLSSVGFNENNIGTDQWRCMLQPTASGSSRASPAKNRFTLAFLEFSRNGALHVPAQLETITAAIAQEKTFVVVYVHGWRHSAAQGDGDVASLRLFLAHSAEFLAQRCREVSEYCGYKVVGIFVSWPARALVDCEASVCNALAAPSLLALKPLSDRIASSIANRFFEIHSVARSADNSAAPNKMIVVGHSLGGNILATALSPRIVDTIASHKPGESMRSVLGDMVVLINPASEAWKWVAIQKAVRSAMKLPDGEPVYGKETTSPERVHRFFSAAQRPVLIAVTSACDWPKEFRARHNMASTFRDERGKLRAINCDNATYSYFSIYRRLVNVFTLSHSEFGDVAIGHLDPPQFHDPSPVVRRPYGTTHEIDATANKVDAALLQLGFDPKPNGIGRCEQSRGWLARSIQFSENKRPPDDDLNALYWDSEDVSRERSLRVSDPSEIWTGVRHSILYGDGGRSITTARDPFWNMRALDTVIVDHNGFATYPLWCTLNQLLLDDMWNDRSVSIRP